MNTAIAQHLNILESAILRVEEWKNVLFIVCRKLGARFVSKKVVKVEKPKMSYDAAASMICDRINKTIDGQYLSVAYAVVTASLWRKKEGETRIYFNGGKGKGFGFLIFKSNGQVIDNMKSYLNPHIDPIVDPILESIEIVESHAATSGDRDPLSTEALAARYGWAEVLDAQADVAREDWDI